MLAPRIFTQNLFDDLFEDPFRRFSEVDRKLYGKHAGREMLMDVKENDNGYEVEIDLPGFKKDEIQLQLNEGYLSVTASKGLDKDEKDNDGKLIRQERYAGVLSRSFYVGDSLTQKDIKARFEDGVLKLTVPKMQENKLPENNYIEIE